MFSKIKRMSNWRLKIKFMKEAHGFNYFNILTLFLEERPLDDNPENLINSGFFLLFSLTKDIGPEGKIDGNWNIRVHNKYYLNGPKGLWNPATKP